MKWIVPLVFAASASALALPSADDGSAFDPEAQQPYDHHNHGNGCGCPEPCPPFCGECLDDITAQKLAATWLYFFVNIDRQLAFNTLTDNFTLYSDSDNTAGVAGGVGNPVDPGVPEYTSALDFIKAQPTAQFVSTGNAVVPAPDPYIILDVFHDCTKIAIRWLLPEPSVSGDTIADIRGIDILETVKGDNCTWQIETAYSEYNNLLYVESQGLCEAGVCVDLP